MKANDSCSKFVRNEKPVIDLIVILRYLASKVQEGNRGSFIVVQDKTTFIHLKTKKKKSYHIQRQ